MIASASAENSDTH